MAQRLWHPAVLLTLAATAVLALYGQTLWYGFHYDDYYFVRPYSSGEVLAAWRGSWDSSGIMVPFYRPLTIAFHALRFELFGLNAVAHHAVSLTLFSIGATLAGMLGMRLTGRFAAGGVTTLVFVVHPAMPYAQVVWITNQMHLLSSLCVLSGLLWWRLAATRGTFWAWSPLLPMAAAAFAIKEDNIMLLPAVVALHWLRQRLVDPTQPRVPPAFFAAAVVLLLSLLVLRHEALGALGGYGRPSIELAWLNFQKGIRSVFWLRPPHRPWQSLASWFAILSPLLALVLWRRITPGTRMLMAAGLALGLLFNLPFVMVSKSEQMHLVAAGAALLVAGSVLGLLEATRSRMLKRALGGGLAAGLLAFGSVGRHISTDFDPFGPIVLHMDVIVRGWAAVPQEIRDYLERKAAAAQSGVRVDPNPVEELPLVVFGMHPEETAADGRTYRWMAGSRAEILIGARVTYLEIPFRHERGAFREPATATIRIDGRRIDELILEDGSWRTVRYPLRQKVSPLMRMQRLTVQIPHPWIPQQIIPHSTDGRTLGLQIGAITIK